MAFDNALLDSIRHGLFETLGEAVKLQWLRNLPGGDINQAALLGGNNEKFFLKYHHDAPGDMFTTEALALEDILRLDCIRVPRPITVGKHGQISWFVMEYLELTAAGPDALLGEQLAAMHAKGHDYYGWHHDNYIGSTPQFNHRHDNWQIFWLEQRLQPQLEMAQARGFGGSLLDKGASLLASMEQLMDGHEPRASLLHGDLWAGNKAFTTAGQAVIFDPASYYGDREADIAMTELFGGFDREFYAAYQAHTPLPDAYALRRDLYNLYHMLNHLNLFGAAYLSRCEQMISSLLSQVR